MRFARSSPYKTLLWEHLQIPISFWCFSLLKLISLILCRKIYCSTWVPKRFSFQWLFGYFTKSPYFFWIHCKDGLTSKMYPYMILVHDLWTGHSISVNRYVTLIYNISSIWDINDLQKIDPSEHAITGNIYMMCRWHSHAGGGVLTGILWSWDTALYIGCIMYKSVQLLGSYSSHQLEQG